MLKACAPQRRLLYETALLSGLRAKELRHLTVDDLDIERSGLHLRAAWTKNRKDDFQPLPQELVRRLDEYAQTHEAGWHYEMNYRRHDAVLKAPDNPLLFVPASQFRDFDKDLEAAGIRPDAVSARVLDVTRGAVRLQTGYLYHYAFAMLIGVAAFITWFMFAGRAG